MAFLGNFLLIDRAPKDWSELVKLLKNVCLLVLTLNSRIQQDLNRVK